MTNMKRSASDSESDDGFDDLKDGSPSHGGHSSDRKRRRGIIEKRRRDRINTSLSELRRLVPAAFEKQGSAKLEKAEILQMTVDHLKILHTKAGLGGYSLDSASLALDYRSVGFRECAGEVARYLAAVEGMDIQDPLRMRLLSHLQCYSAQRDAAAKSGYAPAAWSHHQAAQYGSGGAHGQCAAPQQGPDGGYSPLPETRALTHHPLSLPPHLHHLHAPGAAIDGGGGGGGDSHLDPGMRGAGTGTGSAPNSHAAATCATGCTSPMVSSVLAGLPPPSQMHMNAMPMMPAPGAAQHYNFAVSMPLGSAAAAAAAAAVKPYRPWGAELAY